MGSLVYAAITSLDGFVEDAQGNFDWAMPSEEVHTAINRLEEGNEILLMGRKLYDTMAVWETFGIADEVPPYVADYGRIWRQAQKIVYSKTLSQVTSGKTALKSEFDPDEVRRLKQQTKGNIGIGGPQLAGLAFAAHLVDEIHLFVCPQLVGAGKPALPGLAAELILVDVKRFESGVAQLHYRRRTD